MGAKLISRFSLKSQVFTGNVDRESVVLNDLKNDVQARYVRFLPEYSDNWPCLRVEIFVRK